MSLGASEDKHRTSDKRAVRTPFKLSQANTYSSQGHTIYALTLQLSPVAMGQEHIVLWAEWVALLIVGSKEQKKHSSSVVSQLYSFIARG